LTFDQHYAKVATRAVLDVVASQGDVHERPGAADHGAGGLTTGSMLKVAG
jgi:hypothetical protein